ncbi:hypothetical protein [Motiliproteus sp. SC1-56]|uniref:hypothetical protein n=1 Tax=Motiliproteus sp. SC1-56 TaxID=2799565 RepID=UPI001A8CA08F|nr:hypothetical protein [Motiliproteus sp. SC1-56]
MNRFELAINGPRLLTCALLALGLSIQASAGNVSQNVPEIANDPDVIAHFELVDEGAEGSRPVTFGLPVKAGNVSWKDNLVVAASDGEVLPSQWNPLASWKSDGTVLHGVMSFNARKGGRYYVRRGPSQGGRALSLDDLRNADLKARIEVLADNIKYTISLADLLRGQPVPRQNYLHFAGPLAAEFALGGALREGGTGRAHPFLQGYFHVRGYGRPVERARITFVLENTGAFNRLKDVVGDVVLSVDDQPVYQVNNFLIGADKRYPKRVWWRGDPGLWVRHDTEQIQDMGLVPEYRDLVLKERFLNRIPRKLEWHGRGEIRGAMDAGGAAPYLAPLDRWTAAYLISADRRAYDSMLAHADAYHWVVSKHTYAMRPRDENTGFPLDLAQHPTARGRGWEGKYALQASPGSRKPLRTDMAHQPPCAYVPYLLTADFDYLEQCQLWSVANWVMERPGSNIGWPRPFYQGQVRGLAWGFRNVVNGAVITPDMHPLKKTLDEAVENALRSMEENLVPMNALGLAGARVRYKEGKAIAPWQDDFLTWAIGSAIERGYSAPGLWTWKARAIVERLGDGTRFCWAHGAAYNLLVRPSKDADFYSSWEELRQINFPNRDCPPEGQGTAGIDRTATDYGAQMAGAIAVAVDTGVSGAIAAWKRYDSRQTSQWGKRNYSVAPEWAIAPRRQIHQGSKPDE